MYYQCFQRQFLLKLVFIIGFVIFNIFECIAQDKLEIELQKQIKYTQKWYNRQPEKTFKKLEIALQQMQKSNYLIGEWKLQNIIGKLHFQENRLDKAIEAHQKNIKVAEAMNSIFYKGRSYNSLCEMYMRIDRLKTAEEVGNKAKSIFAKAEEKYWEASVYGNLGNVYTRLGQAEKGLNAYRTTYAIYDSLGIDEKTMSMNLNIGYFYLM